MLFELHNANVDVTHGSLEVTWCLDKELLGVMKTQRNPMVVISVFPLDKGGDPITRKETRFAFPLKQMMGFIHFRMPGKNRVYAYIENYDSGILARVGGHYETDVVYSDGEHTPYVVGHTYHEDSTDAEGNPIQVPVLHDAKHYITPFEVDVPEEYFGKEPAEWEKDWVLWLLDDKGADQCAFRKRRLFAYFVQPLIFIGNYLLRVLLVLGALLIGARGFTMKHVVHPLTYGLDDTLFELYNKGSVFVRPSPDFVPKTVKQYLSFAITKFWSLPFMPIVMLLAYFFTVKHAWFAILAAIGILFALFLVLALLINFAGVAGWIADWFSEKMDVIGGENDFEDLICTGDPNKKPKNRSVKLRYLALKSKVCKPFAG